jgi:hypothetical protein
MVPADEVVSWKGCPWEPQDNQDLFGFPEERQKP